MGKQSYVWLAMLLVVSIMAACAPTPTASVAPVEKEVTRVVEVEKEVTRVVEKPVEVTRVVETVVEVPAAVQEWELVNPEGVVLVEPMELNPHPATLEGKTVALRWNGKQNGNHFLDRVAELLTEEVPGINIVKLYEVEPDLNRTSGPPSGTVEDPPKFAQKIAEYNPDLVIASQAD